MKDTFSIREALSIGWDIFEENPWRLVGIFSLTFVAAAVGGGLEYIPFIGVLLSVLLNVVVGIGVLAVYIKAYDKEEFSFKDVFGQVGKVVSYVLAMVLMVLIMIGGSVLLLIPGIIASIALTFVPMLIVDKGVGVKDSIKMSWAMTSGHKAKIFLFGIISIMVNLIGLLSLIVGLLVTIPVTYLASVHIYRTLLAKAEKDGVLQVDNLQTVPKVFAGIGLLAVVVALVAGAAFLKSETGQSMMRFVEMSEHRGGEFYSDEFDFDQELEALESEMSDLETQY